MSVMMILKHDRVKGGRGVDVELESKYYGHNQELEPCKNTYWFCKDMLSYLVTLKSLPTYEHIIAGTVKLVPSTRSVVDLLCPMASFGITRTRCVIIRLVEAHYICPLTGATRAASVPVNCDDARMLDHGSPFFPCIDGERFTTSMSVG